MNLSTGCHMIAPFSNCSFQGCPPTEDLHTTEGTIISCTWKKANAKSEMDVWYVASWKCDHTFHRSIIRGQDRCVCVCVCVHVTNCWIASNMQRLGLYT